METNNTSPSDASPKPSTRKPHRLAWALNRERNLIPQDWYQFDGEEWELASNSDDAGDFKRFRIITWNIDFSRGFDEPRMASALRYLEDLITSPPSPFSGDDLVVIMLQEMRGSDLKQIRDARWVQERFAITDLTSSHWHDATYGTTTLIDRRFLVTDVFRVPWLSQYGRDGLFVDIIVGGSHQGSEPRKLRLCNSHLESLPSNPPIRPLQVAAAAPYLHAEEVHAAVLAGDANAIQPSDRHIADDNNLRDAYLALGGVEDTEEGYTWGYQSSKWDQERFPPVRMDKVFYCGGFAASVLTRIGVGLKVDGEEHRRQMMEEGGREWVTDHYGLLVQMDILDEKPAAAETE
ncbi:hypothetical protein AJ80_02644 [Polytolypa hystricis UAMH7299]|uniref:Endonuclease/exonuclease/phosphatase domain-containing protein n=1 Tax=Polytolypa hystricis (strain UAMH7299) TaxID=1447883 RepID=A0A2B7YQR7_POLH7|nr:hypothetical protein AJ80_02644 [Polytolypa hystricis UAMH7299]